eukprot:RCo052810
MTVHAAPKATLAKAKGRNQFLLRGLPPQQKHSQRDRKTSAMCARLRACVRVCITVFYGLKAQHERERGQAKPKAPNSKHPTLEQLRKLRGEQLSSPYKRWGDDKMENTQSFFVQKSPATYSQESICKYALGTGAVTVPSGAHIAPKAQPKLKVAEEEEEKVEDRRNLKSKRLECCGEGEQRPPLFALSGCAIRGDQRSSRQSQGLRPERPAPHSAAAAPAPRLPAGAAPPEAAQGSFGNSPRRPTS